jgi:hypothetical protein
LWGFHNAKSGLCFPSYERIAEAAGSARSTAWHVQVAAAGELEFPAQLALKNAKETQTQGQAT